MTQLTILPPLRESHLPGIKLYSRGKVRDVYEVSGGRLLIVATDRLSAFDVVMAEPIPDKGRVLTELSSFWFGYFESQIPHHFLTASFEEYPSELRPFRDQLEGRSMVVKRARPFPIECVVRGFLAGSGWKEYKSTGEVSGVRLPPGMKESSRLDQPIFTPATKAQTGHDENISWEEAARRIGKEAATQVRDCSLDLYTRAREYAATRGIILADTKFEFGMEGNQIILIDEVLTPDSSRFWPSAGYEPGGPQPSFDKQFVRDYLESIGWNKQPPPPSLPKDVVEKTSEKYREAYRLLTGHTLN